MYQERNEAERPSKAIGKGVVEWAGESRSTSSLRADGFGSSWRFLEGKNRFWLPPDPCARRIDVLAIALRLMPPGGKLADAAAGTMKV
jgi:hypothetical protein